jgi:hypothetical protein
MPESKERVEVGQLVAECDGLLSCRKPDRFALDSWTH